MDRDYPRLIEDDFPGIGDKVDAVYEKNGNEFHHADLNEGLCSPSNSFPLESGFTQDLHVLRDLSRDQLRSSYIGNKTYHT